MKESRASRKRNRRKNWTKVSVFSIYSNYPFTLKDGFHTKISYIESHRFNEIYGHKPEICRDKDDFENKLMVMKI